MGCFLDDGIKLQVNTTILDDSDRWVTVVWEGVSDPSKEDWIGLWLMPDKDTPTILPQKHAPVKYQVKLAH